MRIVFKFFLRFLRYPLWIISPRICTQLTARALSRLGATVSGAPNYLSAQIWFDGGDYSRIELGHGVTISSNVRILTHDWAPYTIAKSVLGDEIEIRGAFGSVTLEDYSFVGTGAILLPGTRIGRAAVVGAGAVVKGLVPSGAIVIGNPARQIGRSLDFARRFYEIAE